MEQKSLKETVEVLKVVHPLEHINQTKVWLNKALDMLKDDFSDQEVSVTDKIKIFTVIASFLKSEEHNPMNVVRALEDKSDRDKEIVYAWLEARGYIRSSQKKVKESCLK